MHVDKHRDVELASHLHDMTICNRRCLEHDVHRRTFGERMSRLASGAGMVIPGGEDAIEELWCNDHARQVLADGAVEAYWRPFSPNRGESNRKNVSLEDSYAESVFTRAERPQWYRNHLLLKEYRHQVLAHSNVERRRPSILSRDRQVVHYSVREPIVAPASIPVLREMSLEISRALMVALAAIGSAPAGAIGNHVQPEAVPLILEA